MGRARPSVCAFDCVGMGIHWTARTVVARAWDGRLLVRRLRAFDCSSVWPAWDGRRLVRLSARASWDGRLLVRRLRAFDCSSVWPAWDGRRLVRLSARVVGRSTARPSVCARSTATARRVGMGNMGMEKGTAPHMGRARVHGTNRTLSVSSVLPHWFELLTSNKAVQVAGVHCVRLNSCPSW